MSAASRQVHYDYAEYLAFEEQSPSKHEYLDGEIYAMVGGTPDHAALAAAVLAIIGQQLPYGCRAFTSDLRLRVPSTDLSTYPDGTVICGESQRAADDPVAITNPTILIEVSSDSTEQYDRTLKLAHYQAIPTLREILVVSHKEPHITLHRRADDGWHTTEAVTGESLKLESIGGVMHVDDVYRDGLEDQL